VRIPRTARRFVDHSRICRDYPGARLHSGQFANDQNAIAQATLSIHPLASSKSPEGQSPVSALLPVESW
jgi:hypothetical protein